MNMTHPDILTMEMLGYIPPRQGEPIGKCLYCEEEVYNNGCAVKSSDGLFCDMECCKDYYGIEEY